ncbi:MAG: hypothetical protein ACUVQ3_05200 [bacterium]
MHILIIICFLEPKQTIELPGHYTNFQFYEGAIYLVPFNGKTIIKIDSSGNIANFSVTDEENYRIYEFKITPFYFYLNTPAGIIKMHRTGGTTKPIYEGDITTFVITDGEEIVLADRLRDELIFLDTKNKIRLKKKNMKVIDMDYYNERLYLLMSNSILVFDEYGNKLESIKTPEGMNGISAAEEIYLFSSSSNIIYIWNEGWKRIELKYPVNDIHTDKNYLITLNQYGDCIYIYDKSDF